MMRPLKGLALILLLAAAGCSDASRQEEVAARGAEVMPFDLERTTHVFEERPDGGVQRVVADQAGDSTQIALIREHLRDEAERFAAGDFADPAQIHGDEMPGLAALRAHDGRVAVEYDDLPDGGQIRYSTDDSVLVDAMHRWFEAQRSDHGRHAQSGGHGHDEHGRDGAR